VVASGRQKNQKSSKNNLVLIMLEPVPKKYTMTVGNIRYSERCHQTVVYADSISKAVEIFLQDYLRNSMLTVEISEQVNTKRKV
jgi:hypothetical protein